MATLLEPDLGCYSRRISSASITLYTAAGCLTLVRSSAVLLTLDGGRMQSFNRMQVHFTLLTFVTRQLGHDTSVSCLL